MEHKPEGEKKNARAHECVPDGKVFKTKKNMYLNLLKQFHSERDKEKQPEVLRGRGTHTHKHTHTHTSARRQPRIRTRTHRHYKPPGVRWSVTER